MADYTQIDRPYDAVSNRIPGGTSPVMNEIATLFNQPAQGSSYVDPTAVGSANTDANYIGTQTTQTAAGAVETQQVNSNQSLNDLWINTFIRSANWKPGAVGFNIDGQTGRAEFSDVLVRGTIYASVGNIGGWTINLTSITGGNVTLDSTGVITVGTANDVAILSSVDAVYRLWVGNATAASAPFSVTKAGAIKATAGTIGGWTIAATTLSSAGLILDSAGSIGTSTFVSGQTGWNVSSTGVAEFGNIIARGELHSSVFTKDSINATGGSMIVLTAGVLQNAFTSVTSPSTSSLDIKDPPSGTHIQTFSVNHILRIKDGTGLDNWLKVTAVTDMSPLPYWRYTVDKQSGTNGTFNAGTAVVDYKTATDGFVMLTSDLSNSPYVDIGVAGATPWAGTTPKTRLGNLAGITDPVFGALTGYGLWTGSGYFSGSIFATAGYFGNNTNGITIDSTGLTMTGTGYIRTASAGARIVMEQSLTGGFTAGLEGFDSSNNQVFRLLMDGGFPQLSLLGTATSVGMQIINSVATNSSVGLTIQDSGIATALQINTSGTTARSSSYGLYINHASDNGIAEYIKGGANTVQELLKIEGINQSGVLDYVNFVTTRANHLNARITADNYAQFPSYYHYSEFDEYLSGGNTVLGSTVVAKAFWVGAGTNGTQTLLTSSSSDLNSPIEMATTAAANSTSTLTFGRYIPTQLHGAIEFRFLLTSITNTQVLMGFTDGANIMRFRFDTALDATHLYSEVGGGSTTTTQLAISIGANTWYTCRIAHSVAEVKFYVTDALVSTVGTNIPNTNPTKPYFYVDNKAVAQNNTLQIDYVKTWTGRKDV